MVVVVVVVVVVRDAFGFLAWPSGCLIAYHMAHCEISGRDEIKKGKYQFGLAPQKKGPMNTSGTTVVKVLAKRKT